MSSEALDPIAALTTGMTLARFAREAPERPAIVSRHGTRSFGELNGRANQIVRALRRSGLRAGDPIAFVCANRPEFAEIFFAAYRSGLRILDISDVENPVEVGFFDTVPIGDNSAGMSGAWSNYPYFTSGNVIVTSEQEGLFVLRKKEELVP